MADVKYPYPIPAPGHEYRIEALRAASRIVAGVHAGGNRAEMKSNDAVMGLAEQFARWLEDGER